VLGCVGLLLLVGWTADQSAASRGPLIRRPLHLPHVARGARCPISKGALASDLARGLPHMPITGSPPVFLMSVGGEPTATVSISASVPDDQGWRGQKAPWLASPTYRGRLLIRGRRIDAPGDVRFARTTGQHLTALAQKAGEGENANGWRVWPSLLLVRAPGCYGLQIDGPRLSEVIVIRVHA
jgi:hypothetical protein